MNLRKLSLAVAVGILAAGGRAAAGGTKAEQPIRGNPIAETFTLIFDSESIELDVLPDSLEVRGTYVLLCRTPTAHPLPLFYPFPVDSLLGGARMVSLEFRTDRGSFRPAAWQEVEFASGARWWIPPCVGDTVIARAVYRQQLRTDYARYIVTTTQIWGRALRHAAFAIHLPSGVVPTEFSFPFVRDEAALAETYRFEADDFFPDRDITVRWARVP